MRQLADRDRDEHQVVDAEHDLDRTQGHQGDPRLRIGDPFKTHRYCILMVDRRRGPTIRPHTSNTFIISTNTAAEPMSLARPDSSWNSSPYRLITASTAEFSNSMLSTSRMLPINRARSTPLSPSHQPSGARTANR